MIKIWNVTIKQSTERRKGIAHSIGIEEENHELIVWKHWVGFLPKNDFFHHVILRQNLYVLMDALLKIGTYSVCMKRDDDTHLYSANIVGISLYMIENITGYERHTIIAKFHDLSALGYISFTLPTRGELSEMNILLNEYNKAGLQVFKIEERSWLNERLIVEKDTIIGKYKDIRDIEKDVVGLVDILPINTQQQGGSSVDTLPINTISQGGSLVESLPIEPVDKPVDSVNKEGSLVEALPISNVNTIDDLTDTISRDATNDRICEIDGLSGISNNIIYMIRNIIYNNHLTHIKQSQQSPVVEVSTYTMLTTDTYTTPKSSLIESEPNCESAPNYKMNNLFQKNIKPHFFEGQKPPKTTTADGGFRLVKSTFSNTTSTPNFRIKRGCEFNPLQYSSSTRLVAMFYQIETGLDLIEQDFQFITDALKISQVPQIMTAIQSAKVWRATLPSNFNTLSDDEKKKRIAESQPGFYLKVMGMKHVYNFIKNSPRYRRRVKHGVSTGVKSGLNRKRVSAEQKKIMQEIREKHKKELDQIK